MRQGIIHSGGCTPGCMKLQINTSDKDAGTAGKPLPKGEKGVKKWLRNKLKALASLLGRLGVKAAEASYGITGVIISWILNRAKHVWAGYSKIYGLWSQVSDGCLIHKWSEKSKNCVTMHHNIIQSFKYHKTPPILIMLKVMNANSLLCCWLLWV